MRSLCIHLLCLLLCLSLSKAWAQNKLGKPRDRIKPPAPRVKPTPTPTHSESGEHSSSSEIGKFDKRLKNYWQFGAGRINEFALEQLQLNGIIGIGKAEKSFEVTLTEGAFNVLMDRLGVLTQQSILNDEFMVDDIKESNDTFINDFFKEAVAGKPYIISEELARTASGDLFYPIVDLTVISTVPSVLVTIEGLRDFSSQTKFIQPLASGKEYVLTFQKNGYQTMSRKISIRSHPKSQLIRQVMTPK